MIELNEIAEIQARLSYDTATGALRWRTSPRERWIGKRAGCFDPITGYRRVNVAGKVRYEHRVVWAIVHGEWPPEDIDHINGDRTDNRISNLRAATKAENAKNRKITPLNKSGLKGAYFDSKCKRWRAGIRSDGRGYNLGRFDTKESAHAAYVRAASYLHGSFARVS